MSMDAYPGWQVEETNVGLRLAREGVVLWRGDCLQVLPTLEAGSVDVTMTSPPYNTLPQTGKVSGMHADRKSGVNKWVTRAANGYEDNMPEPEYQHWLSDVVRECLRISQGIVWVNHKVRFRDGIAVHPLAFLQFPLYSEVIWNRRGSMALNCKRFAPSHEGVWGFGSPHFWNDELNKSLSVWDILPEREKDEHPCPYPFELARRPIEASCPLGGTVFDPFTGSGTTAEVCIRTNRKFVGTEKDPRFFDLAVRNITAALLAEKSSLFPAKPKATQVELF